MSPLQREFTRLSQRVAQAQRRLQAWRDIPGTLQARVETRLAPAMTGLRDAEHTLVIQLDALLLSPPKGLRLGAARREALTAYLLELCQGLLAHTRDEMLVAIHDRHSRRDLATLAEEERAGTLLQAFAMLDAVFGEGTVRPLPGETDDAFYARAQQRLMQTYQAERAREDDARARRAERRAARKATRSAAKANARSKRGAGDDTGDDTGDHRAGASADATHGPGTAPPENHVDIPAHLAAPPGSNTSPEHSLRALYRRLASALHPDRAPDGDARALRTRQMKDLNAAWDARDLLALLQLQADTLHGSAVHAAVPDDLARDYIALLQVQLERIKGDTRHAADTATPPDIAIAHGRPRDPAQLMQWLEMDLQRVQRNTRILRDTAAGLADPRQRSHVLDDLMGLAESELARRAVDQFVDEVMGP